jgi:uncharacterized membrane protein
VFLQPALYVVYAVANTFAMTAVKSAMQTLPKRSLWATGRYMALGGVCYGVALAALFVLLRHGDASTVFPIAIACAVLGVNVGGAVFHGESLTVQKVAGTVLITVGIAFMYIEALPA